MKSAQTVNSCTLDTCNDCGFTQVREAPSLDHWRRIYDRKYFEHGKYTCDEAGVREQERRVRLLKSVGVPEGGNILDAGCATGEFVLAARSLYEVWGADISDFAIEKAKELNPNMADRLVCGTLEDLDYPDSFFDAVVLWDVLEHLWDPVGVIRLLRRVLKPDGKLCLSTPNIGAPIARAMGKRWALMTPPEHLCFFDRHTMTQLLKQCGFYAITLSSKGKWVNGAFFTYKLSRVFPKLVPRFLVGENAQRLLSRAHVYVPTGDILYVGAQAVKGGD